MVESFQNQNRHQKSFYGSLCRLKNCLIPVFIVSLQHLNRQTVHKDGKSYYLHRRLRSAMNSLDYYLPYLYTYQRPECEGMPNTNNKIEGTFTNLKKNLNNHSGMSIQNRMRFISGYFTDMLYRMI